LIVIAGSTAVIAIVGRGFVLEERDILVFLFLPDDSTDGIGLFAIVVAKEQLSAIEGIRTVEIQGPTPNDIASTKDNVANENVWDSGRDQIDFPIRIIYHLSCR
jgi:hypothetical protein